MKAIGVAGCDKQQCVIAEPRAGTAGQARFTLLPMLGWRESPQFSEVTVLGVYTPEITSDGSVYNLVLCKAYSPSKLL